MDYDPINWYQRPRSPLGEARCASVDPSLPPPWKEVFDVATGRFYYWNTVTNVTQFDRPAYQNPLQSFYPFPYPEPVTSVPPSSALFEPPPHPLPFSPPPLPTSHQTQPLALPVPVVHDLLNQIAAIQQTITDFSNTRDEALRRFQERRRQFQELRSQWPCRTAPPMVTSSAYSVHSNPHPSSTDVHNDVNLPFTHPHPTAQPHSSIPPAPHHTETTSLPRKPLKGFRHRVVMAATRRVVKKTRKPALLCGVAKYSRCKTNRIHGLWVVKATTSFFPEFDEEFCQLSMGPTAVVDTSPPTATNPSLCKRDVPYGTTQCVALAGVSALDPELNSLNAAPPTLPVISLANATTLKNSRITRQSPPLIGEAYSTCLRSVETPFSVIRTPLECPSSVVSVTASFPFASLESVVFVETNSHAKEISGPSVVNLDWRYDKVGELLVVLWTPVVYPWDIGIHLMKTNEFHGPIVLFGATDVEEKDDVLLELASRVNIDPVVSALATDCTALFGLCPTIVQQATMKDDFYKQEFGTLIRSYNLLFGDCELFHDEDHMLGIHEGSAIVTLTHFPQSLWDTEHLSENKAKEEIGGADLDAKVQIRCFEPRLESPVFETEIPCHTLEFLLELPSGVQLLFDSFVKAPSLGDFTKGLLDLSHCYRIINATTTSQFLIVSGTPQIIIHELKGLPRTFELYLQSEINDFKVLANDYCSELAFLCANCSPYLHASHPILCSFWISIMGRRAILNVGCYNLLMQSHLDWYSLALLLIGATCWKPSSEECYHEKAPTEPHPCNMAAYPLCDECYILVLSSNDKLSVCVPTVSGYLFHVLIFLMGSSSQSPTAAQSVSLPVAIVWNCLLIPSFKFIYIISGPTHSHLHHASLHSALWSAVMYKDIALLQPHGTIITTIVLGVISRNAEGCPTAIFLLRSFSMAPVIAFLTGNSKLADLREVVRGILAVISITGLRPLRSKKQGLSIRYVVFWNRTCCSHVGCYVSFSEFMHTWLVGFGFVVIDFGDLAWIPQLHFTLPLRSFAVLLLLLLPTFQHCQIMEVVNSLLLLQNLNRETLRDFSNMQYLYCRQPKNLIMENGTILSTTTMIFQVFQRTAKQFTFDEDMVHVSIASIILGNYASRNAFVVICLATTTCFTEVVMGVSTALILCVGYTTSHIFCVPTQKTAQVLLFYASGDEYPMQQSGVLITTPTSKWFPPILDDMMMKQSVDYEVPTDNWEQFVDGADVTTEHPRDTMMFQNRDEMLKVDFKGLSNLKKDMVGPAKRVAGNLGSRGTAGASLSIVYSLDYNCTHLTSDSKVAKNRRAAGQSTSSVVYKKQLESVGIAGIHHGFHISCNEAITVVQAMQEPRMVSTEVSGTASDFLTCSSHEDMPYLKGEGMLGPLCYTLVLYWANLLTYLSGLLVGLGSGHLVSGHLGLLV